MEWRSPTASATGRRFRRMSVPSNHVAPSHRRAPHPVTAPYAGSCAAASTTRCSGRGSTLAGTQSPPPTRRKAPDRACQSVGPPPSPRRAGHTSPEGSPSRGPSPSSGQAPGLGSSRIHACCCGCQTVGADPPTGHVVRCPPAGLWMVCGSLSRAGPVVVGVVRDVLVGQTPARPTRSSLTTPDAPVPDNGKRISRSGRRCTPRWPRCRGWRTSWGWG